MRILGTAQLCDPYGVLNRSVIASGEDVQEFLRTSLELGFHCFDTAPSYVGAEQSLSSLPTTVPIHTKLESGVGPMDSIVRSLNRLQRQKVDIAYLHDPLAAITNGGRTIEDASPLIGTYFDKLGTSVYSLPALIASLENPLIGAIQIPANPLWRKLLDAIPQHSEGRPLIFGRSLLAQGLLVLNPEELPPKVSHLGPSIKKFQRACYEIGRSPLATSLLWARDHSSLDGHIIGATSITELRKIASILDGPPLSPEERAVIDNLSTPSTALFDPRSWT